MRVRRNYLAGRTNDPKGARARGSRLGSCDGTRALHGRRDRRGHAACGGVLPESRRRRSARRRARGACRDQDERADVLPQHQASERQMGSRQNGRRRRLSFRSRQGGKARPVLITAFVLIALGILLGLFFPVMFVAALAGLVLLILFFVGGARRAKAESESSDPGVDTIE